MQVEIHDIITIEIITGVLAVWRFLLALLRNRGPEYTALEMHQLPKGTKIVCVYSRNGGKLIFDAVVDDEGSNRTTRTHRYLKVVRIRQRWFDDHIHAGKRGKYSLEGHWYTRFF